MLECCEYARRVAYWKNRIMDEEKERQKEIKEKLESEGLDPEEFDEDEREELTNLLLG